MPANSTTDGPSQRVVLIVEDDEPLLHAYARVLGGAGFRPVAANCGRDALEALTRDPPCAIISDIQLPGMDGLELLRSVREVDLELPVVLLTGSPCVESAARAVELGALRYLVKPVDPKTLIDTVFRAVRLRDIARLKRQAAEYLGTAGAAAGDRAGLEASFSRALDSLWMAYQPIVDPSRRTTFAFEALVRTREATIPNPGALLSAAERLGRVHEVGRAVRASVADTLSRIRCNGDVFINLHSSDLLDETLFAPDAPLSPFADSVVLEITERASLDGGADIPQRIARLRSLGYRIAIDDLGAGYAGLSYFTLLTPDIVKLDLSLVRNLHREEIKRKLIGSLAAVCRELAVRVVAEGIETAEERDAAVLLGCDLLQGYLFARPAPPFPDVTW